MKLIIAIIKPFKLEDVKDAPVRGRGRGHDRHRGQGLRPPEGAHGGISGSEYTTDFLPKAKLEIVVPDEVAKAAVDAIAKTAQTGKIGTERSSSCRSRPSSASERGRRASTRSSQHLAPLGLGAPLKDRSLAAPFRLRGGGRFPVSGAGAPPGWHGYCVAFSF